MWSIVVGRVVEPVLDQIPVAEPSRPLQGHCTGGAGRDCGRRNHAART